MALVLSVIRPSIFNVNGIVLSLIYKTPVLVHSLQQREWLMQKVKGVVITSPFRSKAAIAHSRARCPLVKGYIRYPR